MEACPGTHPMGLPSKVWPAEMCTNVVHHTPAQHGQGGQLQQACTHSYFKAVHSYFNCVRANTGDAIFVLKGCRLWHAM